MAQKGGAKPKFVFRKETDSGMTTPRSSLKSHERNDQASWIVQKSSQNNDWVLLFASDDFQPNREMDRPMQTEKPLEAIVVRKAGVELQ